MASLTVLCFLFFAFFVCVFWGGGGGEDGSGGLSFWFVVLLLFLLLLCSFSPPPPPPPSSSSFVCILVVLLSCHRVISLVWSIPHRVSVDNDECDLVNSISLDDRIVLCLLHFLVVIIIIAFDFKQSVFVER